MGIFEHALQIGHVVRRGVFDERRCFDGGEQAWRGLRTIKPVPLDVLQRPSCFVNCSRAHSGHSASRSLSGIAKRDGSLNPLKHGAEKPKVIELLGGASPIGLILKQNKVFFGISDPLLEGGRVDLGHRDRLFGKHGQPVRIGFGKAAEHEEARVAADPPAADVDYARPKRRDRGHPHPRR